MIFLVSYDRTSRALTHDIEQFSDRERTAARERRLALQLELPGEEGRYEVVLLEAASLDAVRRTHARYFAPDERSLIEDAKAELRSSSKHLRASEGKRTSA
jgi:hypothetical protein